MKIICKIWSFFQTNNLFIYREYSTYNTLGMIGNLLGICIIIYGFLVTMIATQSSYKRQPLPEECIVNNSYETLKGSNDE